MERGRWEGRNLQPLKEVQRLEEEEEVFSIILIACKIFFNNVIPSTPGFAKCSFPLKFSCQNYVYIYYVSMHATCLCCLITVSAGSLPPSSGESVGERQRQL